MTNEKDSMEPSRPRIVLLTHTFPDQTGEFAFLVPEVSRLATMFEIILIPNEVPKFDLWPTPPGVSFERNFAEYRRRLSIRLISILRAITAGSTFREMRAFGWSGFLPRVAGTVVIRASRIASARRWFLRFLPGSQVDLVYSWWLDGFGYGMAGAASDLGIPAVARAHGFEVFDEREELGRIPFQRETVESFDRVFAVSRAGAVVLREKAPENADRIEVRYLGVESPPQEESRSTDNVFRLLSCSMCVEVKRVDLLASAVLELARIRPQLDFEWVHLGDGPTLVRVKEVLRADPKVYERCLFPGALSPPSVREWMVARPYNVFVNVSSSEGLPVTLMEAASSGIPLLATDVGGNSEIVGDSPWSLLSSNPSPHEIAATLHQIFSLPLDEVQSLRLAARKTWANRFSAERNYSQFAQDLRCAIQEFSPINWHQRGLSDGDTGSRGSASSAFD